MAKANFKKADIFTQDAGKSGPSKQYDLALIDWSSVVSRAVFARLFGLKKGDTLSSAKNKVQAGLLMDTLKMAEDYGPLVLGVDNKSLRKYKLYPEYKSGRKKRPDTILQRFDSLGIKYDPSEKHTTWSLAKDIIACLPKTIAQNKTEEADDVIWSVANAFRHTHEVCAVSKDQDFWQMAHRIHVYYLEAGGGQVLVDDDYCLQSKNGCTTRQIITSKCWKGDDSDSIKGTPNCKKPLDVSIITRSTNFKHSLQLARSLKKEDPSKLKEWKLSPAKVQSVIGFVKTAKMNYRLVKLRGDLDVNYTYDAGDKDKFMKLLKQYGFRDKNQNMRSWKTLETSAKAAYALVSE